MIDEVRFLNIINGVLAREGDTTWGEVREVLLNELCGALLKKLEAKSGCSLSCKS